MFESIRSCNSVHAGSAGATVFGEVLAQVPLIEVTELVIFII